jgi:hypothetical protein
MTERHVPGVHGLHGKDTETVYCLLDCLIHGITKAHGYEMGNSRCFMVYPGTLTLRPGQWTRKSL